MKVSVEDGVLRLDVDGVLFRVPLKEVYFAGANWLPRGLLENALKRGRTLELFRALQETPSLDPAKMRDFLDKVKDVDEAISLIEEARRARERPALYRRPHGYGIVLRDLRVVIPLSQAPSKLERLPPDIFKGVEVNAVLSFQQVSSVDWERLLKFAGGVAAIQHRLAKRTVSRLLNMFIEDEKRADRELDKLTGEVQRRERRDKLFEEIAWKRVVKVPGGILMTRDLSWREALLVRKERGGYRFFEVKGGWRARMEQFKRAVLKMYKTGRPPKLARIEVRELKPEEAQLSRRELTLLGRLDPIIPLLF